MKRKKYILTAEQAEAHKRGVVWYIISWILGAVISYFLTQSMGATERFILYWILGSGMVLALYHFRKVYSILGLGSIVLFIQNNWVVRMIITLVTYFILVIPSFLIGWAVLFVDTIMLIIRRPLVYQKLKAEYIDTENKPE